MSPSSTSPSDARAGRYKPPEAERIPECPHPWVRWTIPVLMLLCMEPIARILLSLQIVEKPVHYAFIHADTKEDAFQEFLSLNEQGERYLVMGSSIAHTNIDPMRVTKHLEDATGKAWTGFSGAMFAARYEDVTFYAKRYFAAWPYKHLVVVLEPWGSRPGRLPNMQERLSKPWIERWLMHHSAFFSLRNQAVSYDTTADTRLRGLRENDAFTTTYGWTRTVPELALADWKTPERAHKQAMDMINTSNPAAPEVFPIETRRIQDLRDWANDHGITVWWILPPFRPDVQQFMLPQFRYAPWRAFVEKEIVTRPNNYLIDLSALDQDKLTFNEWWDANHLNPHGAAVYSEEIGKALSAAMVQVEKGRGK